MAKKTDDVKTCKLCGTPILDGSEFALVLYFGSDEDRREFTRIVYAAVPNVHAQMLDHGRLLEFDHEH